MVSLTVNGKKQDLDVPTDTPLLWVLRENLQLTGTKYGCGIALCGACTVHVDGEPVRACVTSVGSVAGKAITTIEGLGAEQPHPLQRAWVEEEVPQCGFCQSGQLMSAAALLANHPDPDDAAIDNAMSGIVCRCGTYQRIRNAIKKAARAARES